MASKDLVTPFTLYHVNYSVRALMIRLMYVFRGKPREGYPDMILDLKSTNISPFHPGAENLSEFYLCKINPDGCVPVLANDRILPKPMPEYINITWYLCDWYPGLIPKEHETTIKSLVSELGKVHYPVLTFGPQDVHALKLKEEAQKILNRDDISDEYRKALEYKLTVLDDLHASIRAPGALAENEKRTRDLCAKVMDVIESNGTLSGITNTEKFGFIFGSEPTVLDAHMLVFLRRLHDVHRNELAPQVLVEWADRFSKTHAWNSFIISGSTNPPGADVQG